MMKDVHILLVDDHAVLRSGLRLLLDAQVGLRVVGEAGDAQEALDLAATATPDLILLDLTLPDMDGIAMLPLLRKRVPNAHVLVLTMHDDEGYLRRAFRAGAAGYVLKKAADDELIAAVRAVMRGENYVHPAMMRVLLDDLLPAAPAGSDPWDSLSEREREVLVLVARGYTAAEIGAQINLSPKTIETYRLRGMEKLGMRSRAALVQFALAHGLLAEA
jgi:DNA-binding NarL/FixJ family response regulator